MVLSKTKACYQTININNFWWTKRPSYWIFQHKSIFLEWAERLSHLIFTLPVKGTIIANFKNSRKQKRFTATETQLQIVVQFW